MLGVPSGWTGVKEAAILDWFFAFMMSTDMLAVRIRAAQMKWHTATDLKVLPVPGGLVCNYILQCPASPAQKFSLLEEFSRLGNCLRITCYYVQQGIFQQHVQDPHAIKEKAVCSATSEYRATMSPDGKIAVVATAWQITMLRAGPGSSVIVKVLKPLIRNGFERTMTAIEATFAAQQDMPAPVDVNGMHVLPISKADLPVVQGVIVSPVLDAQVVDATVVKVIERDSKV